MLSNIIYSRYPQLLLPLSYETKSSPAYKAAVLRGEPLKAEPDFITSPSDSLTSEVTPAGEAQILYLEHRADFEHALRALAYRCEPREILPSVGASTISGLINWEKIRSHKRAYLVGGGLNWSAEFKRFTADKANYCDTIILLSSGDYSSIPASEIGLEPKAWKQLSFQIRKYHELTHFICRKLWPEKIDALRDEVYADCMGILAAFGNYDPLLARVFFGIADGTLKPGGRLEHYITDSMDRTAAIDRVDTLISALADSLAGTEYADLWTLLAQIY